MDIRDGFAGSMGNTPLIRLRKASGLTGCDILGTAEFLNPGGSVKGRAALPIILDAGRRGAWKPGGLIINHGELKSEGSSITGGIGQGRVTKDIEGATVLRLARITPRGEQ